MLHIHQSSRIRASPSDGIVSYSGHLFESVILLCRDRQCILQSQQIGLYFFSSGSLYLNKKGSMLVCLSVYLVLISLYLDLSVYLSVCAGVMQHKPLDYTKGTHEPNILEISLLHFVINVVLKLVYINCIRYVFFSMNITQSVSLPVSLSLSYPPPTHTYIYIYIYIYASENDMNI